MELKNTIILMCNADYKQRFRAEYFQLKIRYEKLVVMCEKWDAGKLEFTPTCPREMYDEQLSSMQKYLQVLEERAKMEEVDLTDVQYSYVQKVKELRQVGDILCQEIKGLQSAKETDLAIVKVQEGIMWLGMELKRVGQPNPYPNSKDPGTGDVVDKTADGLKM